MSSIRLKKRSKRSNSRRQKRSNSRRQYIHCKYFCDIETDIHLTPLTRIPLTRIPLTRIPLTRIPLRTFIGKHVIFNY